MSLADYYRYLIFLSDNESTWVNDTGVTLIQGIAAAGNSVADPRPFGGTPTLDQVVLTTWTTHDVPLRAGAVVPCQRCGTNTNNSAIKLKGDIDNI